MRAALPLALLLPGIALAQPAPPVAPAWFTAGPRYERAARCIAAILAYPQIEDSRAQLGTLQRIIANDGQMDTDLQVDIRTEGDPARLKQLDMVMRHIYDATRRFQLQPVTPAILRAACRQLEAEQRR